MGSWRGRGALAAFVILLTAPAAATPAPAATSPAASPPLGGAWEGSLLVGALRLVLRIDHAAAGWTAALDSLDQGARDLAASTVTVTGDKLDVRFAGLDAGYVAQVSREGLRGTWTQAGQARPLDFTRRPGMPAGGPTGTWDGVLDLRVRVVLHLERNGTGWKGTADSPDQNARGLPLDAITVAGDQVGLEIRRIDARFNGRLQGDRLVGLLVQHGQKRPLELARTEHPTAAPPRPQEPARPLPYDEVELAVPGGSPGVQLACTLTRPRGPGPFGAVVLATGSGPQDRDEALAGHRPFLVLSDALTRAGVAVLRCDDRGVGASTGAFDRATTLDFAADALAALAALRQRPEVRRDRVGIVGHSEGSTVAAIAAARSRDVAFIVLLAPPALNGREIEHLQRAWFQRQAGASDTQIATARAKWDEAYAVVTAERDDARARARLRAIYDGLAAQDRAAMDFDAAASKLLTPWFRTFLALDPRTFLAKVRVPVLAAVGDRDMQVEAAVTVPELGKALAGDRDVTIRTLPGLNHLFQSAATGAPAEYARITETMSPALLSLVSGWVAGHARP